MRILNLATVPSTPIDEGFSLLARPYYYHQWRPSIDDELNEGFVPISNGGDLLTSKSD